jgi:hypothetical protein
MKSSAPLLVRLRWEHRTRIPAPMASSFLWRIHRDCAHRRAHSRVTHLLIMPATQRANKKLVRPSRLDAGGRELTISSATHYICVAHQRRALDVDSVAVWENVCFT